jgi:hypothetical protein
MDAAKFKAAFPDLPPLPATASRTREEQKTIDIIQVDADHRLTEQDIWPAPGSEDTELGVLMGSEVGHGEAEVYTRVQA